MTRRCFQNVAFNGPRKLDNGTLITCCSDCSRKDFCQNREYAATIPRHCDLPAAPEEDMTGGDA